MILIIIGNLLGAWKLCLLKAERTLQCKVIVLERLSRQGHTVYYALVTTRTLGPGDKPHLLHSTLLLIQQFMFFVCWFVKVAIFRTSSRVQGRSLVGDNYYAEMITGVVPRGLSQLAGNNDKRSQLAKINWIA
jgi:hypothetical protein